MVRAAAAVVTDTEQEKELNRNAASDALKKYVAGPVGNDGLVTGGE